MFCLVWLRGDYSESNYHKLAGALGASLSLPLGLNICFHEYLTIADAANLRHKSNNVNLILIFIVNNAHFHGTRLGVFLFRTSE